VVLGAALESAFGVRVQPGAGFRFYAIDQTK
jgi:hypothetical protein